MSSERNKVLEVVAAFSPLLLDATVLPGAADPSPPLALLAMCFWRLCLARATVIPVSHLFRSQTFKVRFTVLPLNLVNELTTRCY